MATNKRFLILTAFFAISIAAAFSTGDVYGQKVIKKTDQKKEAGKLFGFKIVSPGKPMKIIKVSGSTYEEAKKSAADEALKTGFPNFTFLKYKDGIYKCSGEKKWRVQAKLWVTDDKNYWDRLEQIIIAKGYDPKCPLPKAKGKETTGGGSSQADIPATDEESSKAALAGKEDEIVWK